MGNHIFISHSTDDKTVARDICGELEDRGLDVWIAPRDITGGANYKVAIYEAIRDAEALLLLMSEHANQSDHTEREIDIADDYDVSIIPVVIEDVDIPAKFKYMLTNIQRLNIDNPPTHKDYNRIIRSIVSNTRIEAGLGDTQQDDRSVSDSNAGRDTNSPRGKTRSREPQTGRSDGQTRTSVDAWSMHRYGAARAGAPRHTQGPTEGVSVKWKHKTAASIMSSPAVVDGVVYVGSDDANVYALDAETGQTQWQFETGDAVKSSPAVVDGVVYVGSNDANVYALDAETGQKQWQFETGDAVRPSPAVVNGVVYVGSKDHHVYAVDAETGQKRWEFETEGEVWSSPAVVDDVVWIGSDDDYVYALNAKTGEKEQYIETGSYTSASSPAVVDNKVYIMSQDGGLYEILPESDKYHNISLPDSVTASPAVVDDTIYIGDTEDCLFAVKASTFESQWQFRTDDGIYKAAAVVDDTVYFGSRDHCVYALDAQTGHKLWQFETDSSVLSSPTVVDGTVYVGSTDMHIYALE